MVVPAAFIKNWPANNVIGFNANMPVAENESLYLLLEKDFESVRYCLILSQTFHRINSKNAKISLQSEIQIDQLFYFYLNSQDNSVYNPYV